GYLTIETKKDLDKKEEDKKGNIIRQERYAGNMARSFYVGEDVKDSDISAKFEDGVLKITVPDTEKKEAVPEKKTIAIEG
ncbi:MAG: Hsp20 family protein, partial [Eubacterium sp.]|nr:Hsp20 family protein [Eubacterium sp.]